MSFREPTIRDIELSPGATLDYIASVTVAGRTFAGSEFKLDVRYYNREETFELNEVLSNNDETVSVDFPIPDSCDIYGELASYLFYEVLSNDDVQHWQKGKITPQKIIGKNG